MSASSPRAMSVNTATKSRTSTPGSATRPLTASTNTATNGVATIAAANLPSSRSIDELVSNMEKTAEFALHAQKEYYSGHIALLRQEMENVLKNKNLEIVEWKKKYHTSQSDLAEQAKKHELDFAKLETKMKNHAERRLYDHTQQYEAKCLEIEKLLAAKNEMESKYEQTIRELRSTSQRQIDVLKAETKEKIESLETKLLQQEQEYEEALVQVEAEHEKEIETVKLNTKSSLAKHRENTAILVAEMSAARRKLDEKQSTLSNLELVVAEQDDHLHHTATVVKKLTSTLAVSKSQLRVKEEDITRRQYELAGARQDNTVLKNFIEILEHRIAELENREAPALDALMAMKKRITDMATELFDSSQRNIKASEEVKRMREESQRFFTTVNTLRHKLAKKEQWINSVRKEFKFLLEQNTHIGSQTQDTKLKTDLKKLFAQVFDTSDSDSAPGAETEPTEDDREATRMANRVAGEIDRQRRYLEKSLTGIKKNFSSLQARRKADNDSNLQQNIHFLYEVNRLREENKRLEAKIASLKSQMQRDKISRQQGEQSSSFSHIEGSEEKQQTSDANSMTLLAPTSPSHTQITAIVPHSHSHQPQIIHGSTRSLWELSSFHSTHQSLLESLDEAHVTIEQQRIAMAALQRGVEQAIEIAQQRSYEAKAAKRRAREIMGLASVGEDEEAKTGDNSDVNTVVDEVDDESQHNFVVVAQRPFVTPFKHAKAERSPSATVMLPSLAGPSSLPLYSQEPPANSLDARLSAIMKQR